MEKDVLPWASGGRGGVSKNNKYHRRVSKRTGRIPNNTHGLRCSVSECVCVCSVSGVAEEKALLARMHARARARAQQSDCTEVEGVAQVCTAWFASGWLPEAQRDLSTVSNQSVHL